MERNSNQFKENYINFFKILSNNNLHYGMYAYGLTMFSFHNRSNEIEYNPVKKFIDKEWDPELLRRINWGATDDDDINDDFENYSTKFDKETEFIDTNEYLIKRAVELNRHDWSLFYLIGNIQGRLNYNRIQVNDYEFFTKDDFIKCLRHLTMLFLEKYRKDIEYLFNYFDERDLCLKVEIQKNEKIIFFTPANDLC